ncbi:MAG TPA: hypothetical protein VJS44_18315 [Pyrinomonadaceae bacterium]|nr:hypothetical protein [Pyrinomonadaceae bacterium]
MSGDSFQPRRQPMLFLNLLLLALALAFFTQCASRQQAQQEQRREKAGGKVAFVANLKGNWDLFVMNSDGTELTQLTDTFLDERAPAISPNGGQVAYATSDGTLWVMLLATKAANRLPLPAGRYGYPAWLSDGSGIVYTSYTFAPGNEDADFFVYSFVDQTQRPFLIQTGPQDYPSLSPEGGTVAYISSLATVQQGFGNTLTQQLWVASLREGKPSQLLAGSGSETHPAWSPDGNWLAFSSARKGSPDIWIIRRDGQELAQLTSAPAAESSPTWSPDGREILYVSTESGRMRLMLLDVNGRASRTLSPFNSEGVEVKDPHWR